ncbi:unnamed protein product [Orchesella dallaii]|uniref:Protein msta n=1 Tax=Orchesella dallaii TaxID=48710 RepID=A0ABP1QW87_9HEXA
MVNKSCTEDNGQSTNKALPCPICKKVADKKCSGCHNISYCSSEHQKKHWKIHKNECRMFAVKRNEIYGRYLVATRDIPQGTVIFTDEPIATGPKRCTYPVCLTCYKQLDGSYRCSKCTFPMCSEECEQDPIHADNECVIFQRGLPVGSKISNFNAMCPAYECITALRCLLLKERNPCKWEKLLTMEHHNELRKSVPGLWNRNHVNVVKLLLEWYKMKDDFDEETIHSVLGYIDVNCFEIKCKDLEICGVYRDGGLMSHDCVPNTHHAISISEDHKMFVRSSVPIKKGEIITTSYANQLRGTRERRAFLKETKYFDCVCGRCEDRTEFATYLSGVKCTECATGYLLPKEPLSVNSTEWTCTNAPEVHVPNSGDGILSNSKHSAISCNKTMKEEQIYTILKKAHRDIEESSRSTAGSPVSRLERLLKKYSGKILHPNHSLLLTVIKDLNYAYAELHVGVDSSKDEVDLDRLNRSKALCMQLLSALDMIDPGLTRPRGVTLYQLSTPDFQIARYKFQKKEIGVQEYRASIEKVLTYLQTSKEILELDKIVTPNAHMYGKIVNQFDAFQNILKSLNN